MKKNSRGGYCKEQENSLSFMGLNKKLQFETFEEFCSRADEILHEFTMAMYKNQFKLLDYKNYIYKHKFSNNDRVDLAAKDKCFEWIMSYEYEKLSKNDLYSLLGKIRKEEK